MSKTRLSKEAFAPAPELKLNIVQNYSALYADEVVFQDYPKETKEAKESKESKEAKESKESKDEIQQQIYSRAKFQIQFLKLLDAFKAWGKNNDCAEEKLLAHIDWCRNNFFNAEYSGVQPAHYFETLKQNLENIWFILSTDKSISHAKKQSIFKYVCQSLDVCAPGLYTHIEDVLRSLTRGVSLEYWLAELRTNLIRTYANQFVQDHKIDAGYEVHVYSSLLTYAKHEEWAPLSEMTKNIDPFSGLHSGVDENVLVKFSEYFINAYNSEAILNTVAMQFYFELNQARKFLAIDEDKDGWVSATPEYLKVAKELSQAIGLRENEVNFFELSDDALRMRFNEDLFQAIFMRSCLLQDRIFSKQNYASTELISHQRRVYYCEDWCWIEDQNNEIVSWKLEAKPLTLLAEIGNQLPLERLTVMKVCKKLIKTSLDLSEFLLQIQTAERARKILSYNFEGEHLASIFKSGADVSRLINLAVEVKADTLFLNLILDCCEIASLTNLIKHGELPKVVQFMSELKFSLIGWQAAQDIMAAIACFAVQFERVDVIELLGRNKQNLNQYNRLGECPIHLAVEKKNAVMVKVLAEQKADLNMLSKVTELTPIHRAVEMREVPVVRVLAEYKVDVNLLSKDQKSLAHKVAFRGSGEMIKTLAEFKADINLYDRDQRTPAHLAATYVNGEVFEALCEHKADLSLCDIKKYTALDLALLMSIKSEYLIPALKHAPAGWEARKDAHGWPIVLASCYFGHLEAVKTFIEFDIDFFSTKYSLRGLAIHAAIDRNNWETTIRILLAIKKPKPMPDLSGDKIRSQRKNLTNEFIKFAQALPLEERQRVVREVVNSENALGVILNTPRNSISHLFKKSKYENRTQKIHQIITALGYDGRGAAPGGAQQGVQAEIKEYKEEKVQVRAP